MVHLYAISDIHTDYKENLAWIERHCEELKARKRGIDQDDEIRVLLVAGDVSDDLSIFRKTFEHLTSAYRHVFFVSGNHELWVRKCDRNRYDSLGKLEAMKAICDELGVFYTPQKLYERLWVVPVWSWYHASWDTEPDVLGAYPIEKVMMDFHACDWSSVPHLRASGDDSVARHFDEMNDADEYRIALEGIREDRVNGQGVFVVTFSHFLPFQELLPEKRFLFYPNLAKASGSDHLARRVEAIRPDCHVFGHTHFTQDQRMNGTRFVQWPLGYPKEMRRRRNGGEGWGPCLLWDAKDGLSEEKSTYWSDFYKQNERRAHLVTPASYVIRRDSGGHGPKSPIKSPHAANITAKLGGT
jgi:predicted phosphohydrolase